MIGFKAGIGTHDSSPLQELPSHQSRRNQEQTFHSLHFLGRSSAVGLSLNEVGNTDCATKVFKRKETEAVFCDPNPDHMLGNTSQLKTFGCLLPSQGKVKVIYSESSRHVQKYTLSLLMNHQVKFRSI